MRILVILCALFAGTISAAGDMSAVMVHHAHIPASIGSAPTGAGYMMIMNSGEMDDRLLGVEADFPRVEVHNIVTKDGVASMVHQKDGVPLPPGGDLLLAPGGYHIMFMGLKSPFVVGDTVEAVLVFEHAGRIEVSFNVVERGDLMDHSNHAEHMEQMGDSEGMGEMDHSEHSSEMDHSEGMDHSDDNASD